MTKEEMIITRKTLIKETLKARKQGIREAVDTIHREMSKGVALGSVLRFLEGEAIDE